MLSSIGDFVAVTFGWALILVGIYALSWPAPLSAELFLPQKAAWRGRVERLALIEHGKLCCFSYEISRLGSR